MSSYSALEVELLTTCGVSRGTIELSVSPLAVYNIAVMNVFETEETGWHVDCLRGILRHRNNVSDWRKDIDILIKNFKR